VIAGKEYISQFILGNHLSVLWELGFSCF